MIINAATTFALVSHRATDDETGGADPIGNLCKGLLGMRICLILINANSSSHCQFGTIRPQELVAKKYKAGFGREFAQHGEILVKHPRSHAVIQTLNGCIFIVDKGVMHPNFGEGSPRPVGVWKVPYSRVCLNLMQSFACTSDDLPESLPPSFAQAHDIQTLSLRKPNLE